MCVYMVPLVLLGATTGLVREPLLPSAASRSHAAAKQQLPPSGTKLDEFAVLVGRCTPGPRMCASAAFDPPPFPLPEGSRAAVVLFVDSDDSFNGAKKLGAFADRAVDFARRGCAVVAVCSAEGSRPASAARWPSIRFVEDEGGEARRWAGLEGGEIATLVLDLEATPRLAATLRSKADPARTSQFTESLIHSADPNSFIRRTRSRTSWARCGRCLRRALRRRIGRGARP